MMLLRLQLKTAGGTTPRRKGQAGLPGLFADADHRGASDLHLESIGDGYELRHRIDGLLQVVQALSEEEGVRLSTV